MRFSFLFFCNISEELVNDLHHVAATEEGSISRRPSRMSAGIVSNNDDTKSVKFTSSSPTLSRRKMGSSTLVGSHSGHQEDMNTISTIRSLLQYVILE